MNIATKNRKIKSIYKSMKRAKVYFKIEVYLEDMNECLYETEELNIKQSKAVWAELLESGKYAYSVKQLVRYQTGGYCGGIIISGSRSVIQSVAC